MSRPPDSTPPFRRLFRLEREDVTADVSEELQFHLDSEIAERIAAGEDPAAARAAALVRFGNLPEVTRSLVDLSRAGARSTRRTDWFHAWGQDLRTAWRRLGRSPVFSLTAIVTLAIGVGANATMFGLVDRLLLSAPPHIGDPAHVVRIDFEFSAAGSTPYTMSSTSYPVYRDLQHSRSFTQLAASSPGEMVFGSGENARTISAIRATGDFFGLLQVQPLIGRLFGPADDAAPNGNPVAVISHRFWQSEFAAAPAVIGQTLLLDNSRYTIIGVAPVDFSGDRAEPVDVWVPLSAAMANQPGAWRETRGMNLVTLLGRLRPSLAIGAAGSEATSAFLRESANDPGDDLAARVVLSPLTTGLSQVNASGQGRIALWLAAMSLIVFGIAVMNVIILLLLRAARDRRALAVRLALGATRWRVVRQLLTESLLLSFLGGIAALAIAAWGSEAVRILLMPNLVPSERLLSGRVAAVTAIGALCAGLITGLLPALRAGRWSVTGDLASVGPSSADGKSRTLTGLIMAQNALSVVLLVGAGIFALSLHRVRTQEMGFSTDHVLYATIKFPRATRAVIQDQAYLSAEEALRRLPGVQGVTVVQAVPFAGHSVPPISVADRATFPDERQQLPFLNAATPAYFDVMGMHLLQGRGFTEGDMTGASLVIVINQAMAQGLWPSENPIGKCVRVGFGEWPPTGMHASATLPCRLVVGVVNNARPRSIREEDGQARMQYYLPITQVPQPPPAIANEAATIWGILVRTEARDGMAALVRRKMQSLGAELPPSDVRPLQDLIDTQIRPWVLGATMFGVFGALALLLAAIGLYGVRAYVVAQRTREMGIRLALGADQHRLVRLVLREGLMLALAGIGAGLLLTLLLANQVQELLFQTSARNPFVLVAVALVLGLVAVAASSIPAWRAGRVAPGIALRDQ